MSRKFKITALLISFAIAACSISACKREGAYVEDELKEVTTTDTYPQNTDKTLRYWVTLSGYVSATANNFGDTELAKYLEEATGIKVEYEHPVAGQEQESFNILLSSDDMPDILEYTWANVNGGIENAIRDGVIAPLNSYIDKASPNLKALLDKNPSWAVQMMTDGGEYYQYPRIRSTETLASFMTYFIRKDLLEKAGLSVPETLEEWETALYAFRDMGVKTPLSLRINNAMLEKFSPLTGLFGFAGTFYHDENHKVKFGPYEEAFADYVRLLKKWYDDGILDKEFADGDSKRLAALITNGDAGAGYGYIGGDYGSYLSAIDPQSGIKLVPAKVPVRNKGERPMYTQKDWPVGDGAAISGMSKNKELAARFLDFGYSEQGHMIYNFGKEGVSYTYQNTARGDHIPVYTDTIVDSKRNGNLSVAQAMAKYARANYGGPFVQDEEYIFQYYSFEEQKQALTMQESDTLNYKLPAINLSAEEQKRFNDIMTPINTYREETLAKLISGKLDIGYLDTYFAEMKRMGMEDAIALVQKSYDNYLKRKPITF